MTSKLLSEHGLENDEVDAGEHGALVDALLVAIRRELDADKTRKKDEGKIGYDGTTQMVADMMNKPVPILDGEGKPTGEFRPCRTCIVTSGIPYAPNALTADHIEAARKIVIAKGT